MELIQALAELGAQLGAGAAFLLLVGIVAFSKEWVVPGPAYHRHVRECNSHIRRLQFRIDRLEGFSDETLSLGEEAAALLPVARRRSNP